MGAAVDATSVAASKHFVALLSSVFAVLFISALRLSVNNTRTKEHVIWGSCRCCYKNEAHV